MRSFVVSDLAANVLEDQRLWAGEFDSIFEIGSTMTYSNRWHRYCEFNGIDSISLYELRHTFVSIVKSLPAGQVKSIVGHSTDMDTFGIYGHEFAGDSEKVADEIEALFGQILNPQKT